MKNTEFNIKGVDFSFRFINMKPTELLSLFPQLGSSERKTQENTMNFVLEHVEANVEGSWHKIRENDTYFPSILSEKIAVLWKIYNKWLDEVAKPVFQQLAE